MTRQNAGEERPRLPEGLLILFAFVTAGGLQMALIDRSAPATPWKTSPFPPGTAESRAGAAESRAGAADWRDAVAPSPARDGMRSPVRPSGSALAVQEASRLIVPAASEGSETRRAAPIEASSTAPSSAGGLLGDAKARLVGQTRGALSGLASKLAGNRRMFRALFDNETVVRAFMNRGRVREMCASAPSLKSYLMDGKSPGGAQEEIAVVRSFLRQPGAAMEFAGTCFARELANCPSVAALAADVGSIRQIHAANPELLGLMADPVFMQAVTASPQALSAYTAGMAGAGARLRAGGR